jgi:uncharacterized protein YigA (DUF484 family)
MSQDKDNAIAAAEERELTDDEVRAYLRAHPEFLADNPDLIEVLTPPAARTGRRVVDLQQYMVRRLQGELHRLRDHHDGLLDTTRSNMTTQARVHEAAIALLAADSFERLIEIASTELGAMLGVDAVSLAIEAREGEPSTGIVNGVHMLPPGYVDETLGPAGHIAMLPGTDPDPRLFGPAAPDLQGCMLVRLDAGPGAPAGVVGFGSFSDEEFQPEQSTELVEFLVQVLEQAIRAWLEVRH